MSLARIHSADQLAGDDALVMALAMIGDGASLSTTEGVIAYVNPAEERLFGYPPGELIGQHVSVQNAYSPQANARIVDEVMTALRDHGSWSGEWFNRRKDGSVFVTSSQIRTVTWRGATHWLCLQRPIDNAENDRLTLAAEAAQLGIWEWDIPANSFVYSNRARAICGFPPEGDVSYEDVVRATHPDDFPHTSAQARRALDPAVRDRTPFEYRVVRPDGIVRWVRAYGYAVFAEHETPPRPLRYVGTLEDITERILSRFQHDEAARQISLALDSAQMAVWSLDIANRRLAPSAEFNRLCGLPAEASPSLDEIEALYAPGVLDALQAKWAEALARQQTSFETEYAIIRADGAKRWLQVRCDVRYLPDGAPDRAIGVIMDVTDRRLTQQALAESEGRFREAADSAPAPVWMTNERGEIEFVNAALCAYAGRDPDVLMGNVWLTLMHPEDAPAVVAKRQQAWDAGHKPYAFEARFRRADGQWRWMLVHSNPRRGADGGFRGYVGLAIDKTEERDALAELKESEERFRLLADRAPVMIWMSDATGGCQYLNAALRSFWGVEENDLASFDWRKTMHPDDEPAVTAALIAAIGAAAPFKVQGRYFDAAGAVRVVRTNGEPRFSPEGQFLGMIGVNVDVTESVAAQEALEAGSRRLQTVADSAPAMIWTATREGRLTFHNERWSSYAGQTNASGDAWLTELLHSGDAEACTAAWRQALSSGADMEFEARLRRRDGVFRWFLVRASLVRDSKGRVLEWCGSCTDIHDRKLYEQHQKLLLDELNHRVKNTLTVVQSLALQTFRNPVDPAAARKAFDGRLAALAAAHTLLTRSNWESADLGSLVTDATMVCGEAANRIFRSGPSLTLSPKQALSIALVLHELCTNAVKHGALSLARGQVDLTWTLEEAGQLSLAWREQGGPPVRAPSARGFGTVLLERAVAHDVNGRAEMRFEPHGLEYILTLPLAEGEGNA
ncbi:MAG: PAS domain S-box protein [Vitreimonas sp.]